MSTTGQSITSRSSDADSCGRVFEVTTDAGGSVSPATDDKLGMMGRVMRACGAGKFGGAVKASALALALVAGVMPAADAAAAKVAVLGAPVTLAGLTSVETSLESTGLFTEVDVYNVNDSGGSNPSLAVLQGYDAILVYSNFSYADPIVLGDTVADYYDGGGGVVCMTYEISDPGSGGYNDYLQGRWLSDGYQVLKRSDQLQFTNSTLVPDLPSHPVLAGVTSLTVISDGVAVTGGVLDPLNTEVIASINTSPARPLIAAKKIGHHHVVDMAFYPETSGWSGDGARLMANALLYSMTPVNSAPVAGVDFMTAAEDTPVTIDVLANDTDVDGDTLSITSVTPGAGTASVTINSGMVDLVPVANHTGFAFYSYTISDGNGGTAIGNGSVNYTSVNDLPVANNDGPGGAYTLIEDGSTVVDPRTNDTDVDSNPLTDIVNISSGPSHGTAVVQGDGTVLYTPDPNFNGTDSFEYHLYDGTDPSAFPATVTFNVTAVNDPPDANFDAYLTGEDQALNVPFVTGLLANDIDVDNTSTSLIATIVTLPSSGYAVVHPDGSFDYTPDLDFVGVDTFIYRIEDPDGATDTATVMITVGPHNDAPIANADAYSTDEDVPVSGNILSNDTDIDGDTTTASLITGPVHGTLTNFDLDGDFTYTPDPDFEGTDTFTYQSFDMYSMSNVATVTIVVDPLNDAPAVFGEIYNVTEDVALTINAPGVLANDSDPDGDAIQAAYGTDPAHGSVVVNADGSFTYTPDANYTGPDQFNYNVTDGNGGVTPATVSLTVVSVNDVPVAVADSFSTDEDVQLNVPVPGILGNDSDAEGDPITPVLVSGPSNGAFVPPGVIGATGDFVYMPDADFNGTDTFTYYVTDGTDNSDPVTVTITVGAVNDDPVAAGDSFTTNEDQVLDVTAPGILSNDSDLDGDGLSIVQVANVTNGVLALNQDGSFTYTPDPDFNGSDSFSYKLSDGTAESAVVVVDLTVTPVPDAPVAVDDAFVVDEDTELAIGQPGLVQNDSDADGDSLVVELVSGPANGSLNLGTDGSFDYTGELNFSGTDSFTYRVSDGGLFSDPATVTITVREVADAPVGTADMFSTPEDEALVVNAPGVMANDYDADGDALAAVLLSNASNGTLALGSAGGFTYTPNAGFNGLDEFLYMANDGTSNSLATTVTITVGPVNDAPVANDDIFFVSEGTTTTIALPGVLANDTDIDDAVLTATLVNPPLVGDVTLNLDGSFDYTPPPFFNGIDVFTYQANDGKDQSGLAVVVINVLPVNGAPVANPDAYSTNEEEPLSVGAPGVMTNDFDLDGDALTAVIVDNASSGTVSLAGDGSFTYTPYAGFFGTDLFTYQVTDGTSSSLVTTVTIQVRAANDAPVASDDVYNTDEETTLTVLAPGVLQNDTDQDGDALTAQLVTQPLHGSVSLETSGTVEYVPNPNFSGQDSFTYRVYDGASYSDAATVTIQVLAVADVPVANPDVYSTRENTPFVLPAPGVLANDTDADSDALTAMQIVGPASGTLAFPGDGGFTYTPDPGFAGTDEFTYQISDGSSTSNITTVTLHVGAVNDAPLAVNDMYNVYEDTSTTISAPGVLANDTDADDDVLSATLVNGPLNGTVTLTEDGGFVYTPYANYFGEDSFTYQATDGLDNSNVATVVINVLPVDDQPLANEDYFVVDENQQLIVEAPGVLGNDSDADHEALTAILQAEPPHGEILLSADGGFIYTPDTDFNGTDTLTYQANDGTGSSEVTTVTIVVRPRNARPVAADDVYETDEDQALTIAAPGVLVNDTDADDEPLTASLESLPVNGTVTVDADGGFTYTPSPDFSGTDWFTYRAHDQVESSAPALVTITVRAINDLPVANNDNYFTQEETVLTVAAPGVLADDTDADGDALTATVLDSTSSGVLVLGSDGSFVYTPNADFSGVDSFTYRVSDGAGSSSAATVMITVGVVNDVPVAADDVYSLFEDTAFTAAAPGVLANDSDGDGDPLAAQVVVSPVHGALTLNGDGSFTYTPAADFVGTDSFTYQATDAMSDSNIAMVVLTVLAAQDKPLANGDFYSTGEEQPLVVATPGVLGNDVDADGETLVSLLEDNPLHGTVALAQDGSFVYTPEAGYSGTDAFTYRANDGTENSDKAIVTITITPKNDVPVSVDDLYFTDEDTSLSVPVANGVLANDYDLDGDPLQAVLINQPLHGSVVLNGDGSFTYTPQADFNGEDYFIYRAYDTIDYSNPPSRVTIQVSPVQDKPVGVADLYSVPEDKTLTVQAPGVLGNDSDADGETLTAILVDAPAFGVVALAADGGFVYTADEDYFGTDTFTYFANDGTENSDLTTVTLMIGGRNDGPVAVDDLYYANEDTDLSIAAPGILGNDVDDDGDMLQAVIITPPLHGTLALQPSGAFVYTPNPDYSGEDRFVYRASDGTTLSNPATVTINVVEINDLPVLSNVTVTPALYENQTAVLQGDLYDADFTDTFLVTVNWGDGTAPTVQSYPAGTSRIFLTHLYADDNPTGTPVDVNAVSVTVQDSRGGADTENREVEVSNLAPQLENVTLTQVIPTGGTARLQGMIKDMGLQDTFAMGIWWGDGQAEVHNFGAGGSAAFDYTHTYAVPGFYTVTVGVMDDDMGIAVQYPSITVRNTSDLILTKTANPDPASVGELVTYTMVVTNNGPDLARNVILMDTMPSNVDVISANPPFVPADGVLNWFLGDMASGQTVRVDLVVKTRQQGPVQNIATVISDELDPVPANNTASVTTTIGWLPDGPDLQAQAVTLESVCKITDNGLRCKMNIWALVANRGNEKANSSVMSAYLSVDNILSADDIKLFTKRFTKLAPGQVKGQHQTYKAPYGLTSSGKFVIVVIDEGNLVFEGNETNNLIVNGPLP